jgi:periplasmic divalent cation tolerance protein
MQDHYLVITSWPDFDGAAEQARGWLESRLAASVNILPQMDSLYRWKGEIRHGREHKIFVKTTGERLDELRREIRAAHPYEVAEILQFRIDSGDPEYLDWITSSTR